MRDDRPDLELDRYACGTGAFGKARGIIEKNLVRSHVNEKRRKPGKIGVKRGRERIAWIGIAEIVARGEGDTGAIKHGTALGVGTNGVASSGEIGPGRKKSGRRRKWSPRVAKGEQQGEREAAAGGFSRNDNALRWITSV
jgi:hypothetical protein